jgi:deazaflavin-dependent oxidoreductase (nitroreductase family)
VAGQVGTIAERISNRIARSDFSSKMHRFVFLMSGGRLGNNVRGVPVLLLTTVGRHTKKRRTVPLMYLADGDRMLVVASNASSPERPPGWWFNLTANPRAHVRAERRKGAVGTRQLHPDEQADLWPRLAAHNPNWARFQEETARTFAVISLVFD